MRNKVRAEHFELLVAVWQQSGDQKNISEYARMEFSPASWSKMFGTASENDIRMLDAQIKAIPARDGPQPEARAAAHAFKRELTARHAPILSLQPKIGAQSSQRRLQASCRLDSLISHSDRHEIIGPDRFAELGLPTSVYGPPRALSKQRPAAEDSAKG